MTDKQTEALKLGLEAIEACLSAGTEAEDQDASDKLCDARAAIREALEQPAQKRPQNCGTGYCSCIECLFEQPNIAKYLEKDNSEQPAQQQEPFGYFKAEPFGWTDCAETDEGAIALYERPQPAQPSKPWVGLVHEETHEAIGTAGVDLLELAKMWSDNKVHVYQFDNEARKIIEAVLRRASAKLREKNA